jgi:hypothetical protein
MLGFIFMVMMPWGNGVVTNTAELDELEIESTL